MIFSRDLSDAFSAMHCLQNNISVPGHLLEKFDLGVVSGLESDEEKTERLTTKDKGRMVKHFVTKAKTPFFDNKDKNLKTIEVFKICADSNKNIAIYWLNKLENLDINKVIEVFNKIPKHLISNVSIEFALKILEENKVRLLEIKEALLK